LLVCKFLSLLLLRLDYSCAGTVMAEEDAASRRERLISLRLQAQQASASSSSFSPASSSHSPSLPKFSNPFSDQPFLDSPNIPSQARTAGFDFYTDPVAAFRSSKGRGGRGGAPWQQQQQQPPSPFHATGSSSVHRPVVGHSFRGPPPFTPPGAAPLPAPPLYNHPPFRPSAPLPQGRGSWPSRGGGGGGRGSWPGSSSQRMRPEMKQGSRAAKYPRRGGEYERAQGGAVSAKERPDLFYSKSMVEDPWKDLVVAEDTRQQG
jgi:hypothetical protein